MEDCQNNLEKIRFYRIVLESSDLCGDMFEKTKECYKYNAYIDIDLTSKHITTFWREK